MVTIAEWFGRAREISLFTLQWHFITGSESYLVCNGSITMLKKSFELTSQADIYPGKWPTEERDYQKIKKEHNSFLCEIEMEQNWEKHQPCKHSKMFHNRLTFFFSLFGCFSFHRLKAWGADILSHAGLINSALTTHSAFPVTIRPAACWWLCPIARHRYSSHHRNDS